MFATLLDGARASLMIKLVDLYCETGESINNKQLGVGLYLDSFLKGWV